MTTSPAISVPTPDSDARERRTSIALFAWFCAGWLVCLTAAAAVCRSLYGDGSYVVLAELGTPPHYLDFDVHRSFAGFIAQTPALLGRRFGIGNVTAYAALYTFGTHAVPAGLFAAALFLARALPGLFAATAAAIVVFAFGVNFTNSESNLFFALAWLSAVILVLPGRHAVLRGYVLPMLAFVLLRVYEGMLLAGPVLAVGSLLARRDRTTDEKIGLTIAAVLFTIAACIAFSSYVAPADPGNAANFRANVFTYLRNPQALVLASALCGLAAMTCRTAGRRAAWLGAAALLAAIFVWRMADLHGYYAYALYYENRSFLVFLLALWVACLVGVARLRPAWLALPRWRTGAAALAIPFVAVVVVDLLGSARWMSYMRTFCDVLDDPAAALHGIDRLQRDGALTGWPWTHPSLSILLRREGSQAIVPNGPVHWQPADLPGRGQFRGACENRRFASGKRSF